MPIVSPTLHFPYLTGISMELNEDFRQAMLQRAKQGDPQGIATLLNRALQTQGLSAKVTRTGDRLKVMLESDQVPNADTLVPYLQNSLTKLAVPSLGTVQVYGRQRESAKPAWSRSFELVNPAPPTAASANPQNPPSPPIAAAPRAMPLRPAAPRRKSSPQGLQVIVGAIAALTLIMIGANIRSIISLATGTPNFVATSAGPDGLYQAPIIDSIYGIPVINVTFNDQVFPMMVDTGASGTLVTQPMAAALQIRPIGKMESSTANGTVLFDVGYVRSMDIDGARVYNVPVAVGMADLEIGLLGHDFYQYFDVVIRRDVVEFHPRSPR